MKKLLLSLIAVCCWGVFLLAQTVPQGMSYQAVARDAGGQVMANQNINLRISLLGQSANGKTVYSEFHQVNTNEIGLFTLTIGEGKKSTGAFIEVPWSTTEIWMDIALAEGDNAEYKSISTTRLLAVPYAFHAGTAGELTEQNTGEEKFTGPFWKSNGNAGVFAPFQFLGTLDANPLIFKTNNQERLSISASGEINIDSDLSVGNDLVVGNELDVNGPSTLNSLTVENGVNLNTIGGTTSIEGNTTVGGTATITGETTINNKSNLNGQVTIDASLPDAPSGGGYANYPLQVQGSGQGIAINVDGIQGANSGRGNNYISFFKGSSNMKGRIEGMNAVDLDPTGLTGLIFSDFFSSGFGGGNANIGIGTIGDIITDGFSGNTSNFEDDADNYDNVIPSQTEIDNFNDQISSGYVEDVVLQTTEIIKTTIMFAASVLSVLDPEDVFSTGVDLTVQVVNMGIFILFSYSGLGVAYESGAGDYAEWLLRADEKEILTPGEVVGVIGGKISKEFTEADQFMVISTAPAVLGNMPENQAMEFLHEKVAFMGQVPVKVIGEVNIGDYILPSSNGDGFAMAVAPEDMKAKDYGRIVGIAWEASDGEKAFQYVKTAVGINANDMAGMIDNMQSVMNEMQRAIQEINPNYEPTMFQTNGHASAIAENYSISPTMNQHIVNQLNISEDASLEDKMKALKQYAYDNGAGEYLEQYPYFFDLLENPTDMELVTKVIDEYTVALQNAQAFAAAIENAKRNRN